jgi:glycosyltransferase involved in cell wall biosynthesis
MERDVEILFVSIGVHAELMEIIGAKSRYPQFQAYKLIWNIVHGIEAARGTTIDMISAYPVNDYPAYPGIFFRYGKWKHNENSEDRYIPFINIFIVKHITRFISSMILISNWLIRKKSSANNRIVLIYSMHSPFVMAALIAKHLFGGKSSLIIPDMPAYMDLGIRRGWMRKISKNIDAYILHKVMNKMDGLIVLTQDLANDFVSSETRYMVMEGSVSVEQMGKMERILEQTTKDHADEKIIMYAGALTELRLLLDAFSLISESDYRLWICGRGEMEKEIKNVGTIDKRITYWEILPSEDLLRKEMQATVLVNVRSANTSFIKYSFPSKILEYMLAGRPVVTTALPGIPKEYYEYLYLLKKETPEDLAELLMHVCSKDPEELSEFGRRAREFVKRSKNHMQQGERIYNFLLSL